MSFSNYELFRRNLQTRVRLGTPCESHGKQTSIVLHKITFLKFLYQGSGLGVSLTVAYALLIYRIAQFLFVARWKASCPLCWTTSETVFLLRTINDMRCLFKVKGR